jgi:hypothetical protein
MSGNIYFTAFQGCEAGGKVVQSDSEDPTNYDAYQIRELTVRRFVYRHVAYGDTYVCEKVEQTYEIHPPNGA